MAKFIDAEKLTRAIEDKGLDCSFALKMERLDTLALIDELQQEQPSEDLKEAAKKYATTHLRNNEFPTADSAFIAGAEWQKEQFEKNRLAACDAQTREEYERETDFVDKFIAENQRTPTFSDAINYGIAWQKEQMLKDAIHYVAQPDIATGNIQMPFIRIGFQAFSKYGVKVGDKVKIIIVKEE